jgi:hypothetical protein
MISHPTAAELSEAIAAFDAQAFTPGDARHRGPGVVGDTGEEGVAREAEHGARLEAEAVERLGSLLNDEGDFAALNGALCEALRSGRISPRDPVLLAHLRATAIGQIRIDQPTYGGLEALLAAG